MAHLFNPEEFLEIARDIIEDEKYPLSGRFRTSIGRAYYAAFLMARKKLGELGERLVEEQKIHAELRDKLRKIGRVDISKSLEDLFSLRIDADYFPKIKINQATCFNALGYAENIINLINSI